MKQEYVDFLLHCYIDAEVDNKETFTKEFMWNLFEDFGQDIDRVSNTHTHNIYSVLTLHLLFCYR